MRLASLFYAILALTAVSALAVPKPRASIEAPVEARAERRQVGGGFSRSCSDYHIHKAADGDWYIEGTCRNNAGGQTKSGLNLNICLANIKSVLKWQLNGQFQSSCRNIGVTGARTLIAQCRTSDDKYFDTYMDLDKGIFNNNGFLRCW